MNARHETSAPSWGDCSAGTRFSWQRYQIGGLWLAQKGQRSGGRNAKSVQEHELTGTFRRDRHGDGESISAPEGVPTPPVELSGEALAEWARMVDRLQQTSALSAVDDAVLYQYVRRYAETEALAADQKRLAETIEKLDSYIDQLEPSERGSNIANLIKLRQIEVR